MNSAFSYMLIIFVYFVKIVALKDWLTIFWTTKENNLIKLHYRACRFIYHWEREVRKDLKVFLAHFAGLAVQMHGREIKTIVWSLPI